MLQCEELNQFPVQYFGIFQTKYRVFAARLSVEEALTQQILSQQLTSHITLHYLKTKIPS